MDDEVKKQRRGAYIDPAIKELRQGLKSREKRTERKNKEQDVTSRAKRLLKKGNLTAEDRQRLEAWIAEQQGAKPTDGEQRYYAKKYRLSPQDLAEWDKHLDATYRRKKGIKPVLAIEVENFFGWVNFGHDEERVLGYSPGDEELMEILAIAASQWWKPSLELLVERLLARIDKRLNEDQNENWRSSWRRNTMPLREALKAKEWVIEPDAQLFVLLLCEVEILLAAMDGSVTVGFREEWEEIAAPVRRAIALIGEHYKTSNKVGKKPYGVTRQEKLVLGVIEAHRTKGGWGYKRIADYLNSDLEAYPPRRAKRWSGFTVQKICESNGW